LAAFDFVHIYLVPGPRKGKRDGEEFGPTFITVTDEDGKELVLKEVAIWNITVGVRLLRRNRG
ncbi:MAG: hypothetical protein V8R27_04505, partial [Oscillospiraceae bacterium]